MKQFLLNEEQVQQIATVLLELPAKQSLASLDILRSLAVHENKPSNPVEPLKLA